MLRHDSPYFDEQYEDPDPDPDPTKTCSVCGSDMNWTPCDACDSYGLREYDGDLEFEDPLWYQPGDTEPCPECDGAGGWWECWNMSGPEHLSERLDEERRERDGE